MEIKNTQQVQIPISLAQWMQDYAQKQIDLLGLEYHRTLAKGLSPSSQPIKCIITDMRIWRRASDILTIQIKRANANALDKDTEKRYTNDTG